MTADYGSNQVSIRFNNGSGVFGAATVYPTGTNPFSVFAADLDRDGDNDLITADYGSNQVSIRFNNGSGGFSSPFTFATGTNPISVIAADLNNDGFLEIITADYTSNQVTIFSPVLEYIKQVN